MQHFDAGKFLKLQICAPAAGSVAQSYDYHPEHMPNHSLSPRRRERMRTSEHSDALHRLHRSPYSTAQMYPNPKQGTGEGLPQLIQTLFSCYDYGEGASIQFRDYKPKKNGPAPGNIPAAQPVLILIEKFHFTYSCRVPSWTTGLKAPSASLQGEPSFRAPLP